MQRMSESELLRLFQAVEELTPEQEMAYDTLRAVCELKMYRDVLLNPDGSERITLDRLRELVAAEQDGRVAVLPCKVGDTVYAIVHCDEVMKDCDDDYVTGTGAITCPFEDACVYEECDDSNEMIVETCVSGFWQEGEGTWKVFFEHINADIGASDFGKTVFLTRAEAEQALVRAEAEAKGEQE